uniref:Uncharacterized protein n=1 Tax=Culex tarsalis TaxID=7177 RepID=A0A1Q3FEN9_CULTA
MACSCCSRGDGSGGGDSSSGTTRGENGTRYPYGQDGGNVTEKHYGCYKVGILFSVIIILLLLVGCVPVFFLTHNNNLILLVLLVTLILIGIVTYAYFRWQHRRALQMRRSYEQQKMNLTRGPKAAAMANGKRPELVTSTVGHKQAAPSTPITAKPIANAELDLAKTTNQPRYSFI